MMRPRIRALRASDKPSSSEPLTHGVRTLAATTARWLRLATRSTACSLTNLLTNAAKPFPKFVAECHKLGFGRRRFGRGQFRRLGRRPDRVVSGKDKLARSRHCGLHQSARAFPGRTAGEAEKESAAASGNVGRRRRHPVCPAVTPCCPTL
jgi:hypothetical protein